MPDEGVVIESNTINEENIDVVKIYMESFNGKQELNKAEINKYFKALYETCNINFLIGSGYCFEKLRTLGDLESLIEKNGQENSDNHSRMRSIEALLLYDFFRNSIFPHKQDIEARSSFENSNRFITKLISYINDRNDKNLLKRVNLFTTNYDMFFELSLEANHVYYNDGFSGRLAPVFSTKNYNRLVKQIVQNTERESQIPTVNLYKLHGSLAWNKKSNEIGFNFIPSEFLYAIEEAGAAFDDDNFVYERNNSPSVSDAIDTINMLGTEFGPDTLRKVEDFVNEYNKLHIINPTKKKFEETLLSNVYYDLLRMYSNELEKNNTVLFVFGFSFKDEHIYSITKRALSNPSMVMYIFVFSETELDSFKQLFKDHHNVFFVYCSNKLIDLKEFNSLMFGE